jgi:CBS domain-containing protein
MVTASDLMTKDFLSVTPEASVADVAQVMLKNRVSALPVVDQDQHLIGMVSEGDLIRSIETGHQAHRSRWLVLLTRPRPGLNGMLGNVDRTVGDVMSRDILLASEHESLARLVDLLSTSRIKRLPVVKDGKLIGIVSRVDVLKFIARTFSKNGILAA